MKQFRFFACALAALVLLSGCAVASAQPSAAHVQSPATGHLTGRLLMEGGPLGPGGQQPGARPIPGTVTFTAGHRHVSIQAGSSGTFSAWLPPGRYQVSGRSPDIKTGDGSGNWQELPCSQPTSVTVTAGHPATIAVTCYVP